MRGIQVRCRRRVWLLAGAVSMLLAAPARAEFDRGEALYEDHCRECHETWAHTRADHKVKDLAELHKRVVGWSVHSGLDWTEEEVDDVVRFLNHRFYRFTEQP